MADFHQNGVVTTLHNLTRRPLAELESELKQFSESVPMGLVLPSLYSELSRPALGSILEELAKVDYLEEVVIGLDGADEEQYRHALRYFAALPQRPRVLWHDGPRLRTIDAQLKELDLAPEFPGKGRNVWYCFGYMLATGRSDAVALHDCDITTYSRELLARLIYPVANPSFKYAFCKGYYPRIAGDRISGRVTRLFVTPLLRSLKRICGPSNYLEYLDSFRYPLAGEFSLRKSVLKDLRIPCDWGLEVGVLSEVHRNYSTNRLCQVDIADVYDHKHQDLSPDDVQRGLSKMSIDIAKAVFRKLATQGEVFSHERFRTIKATYFRIALDFMETYHDDAMMNGLRYDRHVEENAVELFAQNIMLAGKRFLENPMETPFIPSWRRVASARPGILTQLREAADADMAEYAQ